MTPLDSFLFLGVTVAFLWVMWLLLNLVFDCIENYHAAWREERYAARRAWAEDQANLEEAREASGSR